MAMYAKTLFASKRTQHGEVTSILGMVAHGDISGMQGLVATVIQGAVWDAVHEVGRKKVQARRWIQGEVFEFYCLYLNIQPGYIRRMLKQIPHKKRRWGGHKMLPPPSTLTALVPTVIRMLSSACVLVL